ncbi:MAG: 2-hydroxy-3-oxopropionate reductase [Caldilineaceae bacterium]|nr:2-hydroxy-3-oxopropionate reductase [Caldilineaceae bacterium]
MSERRDLPEKETVGFIGLGIMGRPMARNVLAAGFALVVYDLMPEPVNELVNAGASAVTSPAEVAASADVVLLCLPDSPDVEAAMSGPQGLLAGTRQGQIVVDMSTISPVTARALSEKAAAQGVILLDAPVSGGQVGAANGTLSIMVGGDAAALDRVRPILAAMGKTILHLGDSGAGQVAKACNQLVIAVTIEAVAEAMVLAAKAGVDPAKVRAALLGGYANSRVLDGHGERFLERNFTPGFRTRLQYKDLNIAMDAGRAYGAPLPAGALVHQLYAAMMARGDGDLDHSALVTLLEELAGQSIA